MSRYMKSMRSPNHQPSGPAGIENLAQAGIALPDGLYVIPLEPAQSPARPDRAPGLHRGWLWLDALGFALPLALLVLWQAAMLLGY